MNVGRHTITLNEQAFNALRGRGKFGESYSDLIMRLAKGYLVELDSGGNLDR